MTINLTELRDEPLGKHPSQAIPYPSVCRRHGQDVVAADHESISTFDVDSLNDEALDPTPAVCTAACRACGTVCKAATVTS